MRAVLVTGKRGLRGREWTPIIVGRLLAVHREHPISTIITGGPRDDTINRAAAAVAVEIAVKLTHVESDTSDGMRRGVVNNSRMMSELMIASQKTRVVLDQRIQSILNAQPRIELFSGIPCESHATIHMIELTHRRNQIVSDQRLSPTRVRVFFTSEDNSFEVNPEMEWRSILSGEIACPTSK